MKKSYTHRASTGGGGVVAQNLLASNAGNAVTQAFLLAATGTTNLKHVRESSSSALLVPQHTENISGMNGRS